MTSPKPLLTLYVNATNATHGAGNITASRERLMPSDAEYVPASALAEANEALRAANEEVERLRDVIQRHAPAGHLGSPEPRVCHSTCVRDEDDCCVDHWPTMGEDECTAAPQFGAEEDDCSRCLLRAALSPRPGAKESADE